MGYLPQGFDGDVVPFGVRAAVSEFVFVRNLLLGTRPKVCLERRVITSKSCSTKRPKS